MRELMVYSGKNQLQTKMLESYVVDYSNSAVYPFEWIMLNHWIYCANAELLKSYVLVNSPKTGERISLTNKEALLLYFYAYFAALNVTLVVPPVVVATRVTRQIKPPLAELMQTVDASVFSAASAEVIRVKQPPLREMVSTQAFYEFGRAVYACEEWQVRYIANHHGRMERAYAKNTVSGMYSDTKVVLGDGFTGTYAQWFSERNINIATFSVDDFTSLYTDIFRNATGMDRNAYVTTRSIQRAMMEVMKQLSSYSVQYITGITDSNIVFTNFDGVRLDIIRHESEGNYFGGEPGIVVQNMQTEKIDLYHLNAQTLYDDIGSVNVGQSHVLDDATISLQNNTFFYEQRLNLSGVIVGAEATPSSDPDVITVPGVEETYNILSQSERALIRNAYEARRYVDDNLYAIYLARKTFALFRHFTVGQRIYNTTRVGPDRQISLSSRAYKVRLDFLVSYPWLSSAHTSVVMPSREIAYADAVRVYGPFVNNSIVNPWEIVTLDRPELNALTITANDIAMLSRITLSPTF